MTVYLNFTKNLKGFLSMKRFIVLLLALVMVVSCFAACGDDKGKTTPQSQSTPKPGGSSTGDKEIPENEKLNLDLDSIDHEEATVTVFHWKPENGCVEFGMEPDQINNDAVNDAIYKRNSYTETGLGISIEWIENNYAYNKMTQFTDKLRARLADPMTPVDIVAAQTTSPPAAG